MKVILLEDVKAQGKKGQIVEVSDAYGRNVLIAKKLGVEATPKALNDLKLQKKHEEKVAQEQYEAASLDGASRLQKMRYITLPGIIPTITIMLIMKVGQVMSVGYEKIILLSNTVTWETAEVISSYVYRTGLAADYPRFSYSAAIGLVQSVINMVLVLAANRICRKLNGSGLW